MTCKKLTRWCAGFFLLIAIPGWAADLSSDVRKGANNPHDGDGNYVELGISVYALSIPFYGIPEGAKKDELNFAASIDLNLHLQYKGWFMEGFSQSLEEFTLGYNFANGERWSLDIVGLEQHQELSDDVSDDLKGLKKREADFMIGARATGYYENYIVQLHGLSDVSDVHEGQVYSIKLARHWQYKNWNFHAIAGASYRSSRVADYYLSVLPEDANEKFHEFHARAGFTQTFEIGATYPLSQKWVFRGLIRRIDLDSQWMGSPLIISDHSDALVTSISYVF
ncbi:MAG: MipA/OmpV family protein [Cellvibrio sp.]